MAEISIISSNNTKSKPAEEEEEEATIMALPIDIITIIFLKLLIRPLLRCQCVCKSWYNIINTSYFTDRHRTSDAATESQFLLFRYFKGETPCFKLYAVNPEISGNTFTLSQHPISDFTLKSAVPIQNLGHGLFLFGAGLEYSDDRVGFLYNPIRRQTLILPPPVIDMVDFHILFQKHGLCFDKSSMQYKLVCVSAVISKLDNTPGPKYVAEVFSLGSHTWKQITAVVPRLFGRVMGAVAGTPAYEDIHWIAERDLISFEATKEEFKVTPIPGAISSSSRLFTWRDELAILEKSSNTNTPRLGIWVLRDYNSNNKWEEVYALTFPLQPSLYNFGIWMDGIVFDISNIPLVVNNNRIGGDWRKLLYWNTKEGCLTAMINESPSLLISGRPYEQFTSYTVNLVSLARTVPEGSA